MIDDESSVTVPTHADLFTFKKRKLNYLDSPHILEPLPSRATGTSYRDDLRAAT